MASNPASISARSCARSSANLAAISAGSLSGRDKSFTKTSKRSLTASSARRALLTPEPPPFRARLPSPPTEPRADRRASCWQTFAQRRQQKMPPGDLLPSGVLTSAENRAVPNVEHLPDFRPARGIRRRWAPGRGDVGAEVAWGRSVLSRRKGYALRVVLIGGKGDHRFEFGHARFGSGAIFGAAVIALRRTRPERAAINRINTERSGVRRGSTAPSWPPPVSADTRPSRDRRASCHS